MKSYILFIIYSFSIVWIACGNTSTPKQTTLSDSLVTTSEKDTLNRFDTIQINGYTIQLTPASQAEYNVAKDQSSWLSPCKNHNERYWECLQKWYTQKGTDTLRISQPDSLSYRIRLSNGSSVVLKSTENSEQKEEQMLIYTYAGQLAELPWMVFGRSYYEGFDVGLLNLQTGRQSDLFSFPQLSSDKQWLIAANYDLDAGFTANGIQLFQVQADTLCKFFQIEPEKWGPTGVKWISSTEAIIEQTVPDYSNNPIIDRHYYARLSIRKN